MVEKVDNSPDRNECEPTGLEFELGGNMGEQLVFDTSELVHGKDTVEIDLGGAQKKGAAEEFSLPERYVSDSRYISESFIDDPMQLYPTYVPRFTEASEKYKSQYRMPERAREVREADAVDLDPTAEVDEGKEAPHIIVPGRSVAPDISDESIRILKFEQERENDSISAEEKAVEALKNVVIESARPAVSAVSEDESADAAREHEDPTVEEVEAKASEMPDPFLELTLVDYTPSDNDPESLSAEEAPLESVPGREYGEFVRPSQRDATKDGFLDHIVSVKIRLIGALILLASLVVFDILSIFSINVFSIFGIGGVSYAAAAVDMQFAACLALFAAPEIYRALRNLSRRVFSPELVMIVSLVVIAIHSLTVIMR